MGKGRGSNYLIASERNDYFTVDGGVCDEDGVCEREEEKRKPNDEDEEEDEPASSAVLEPRLVLLAAFDWPVDLGATPTLKDEDVGVDVLHLEPVRNGKRRVCPHPIHQRSQLQQEWYCKEAEILYTVNSIFQKKYLCCFDLQLTYPLKRNRLT